MRRSMYLMHALFNAFDSCADQCIWRMRSSFDACTVQCIWRMRSTAYLCRRCWAVGTLSPWSGPVSWSWPARLATCWRRGRRRTTSHSARGDLGSLYFLFTRLIVKTKHSQSTLNLGVYSENKSFDETQGPGFAGKWLLPNRFCGTSAVLCTKQMLIILAKRRRGNRYFCCNCTAKGHFLISPLYLLLKFYIFHLQKSQLFKWLRPWLGRQFQDE